MAPEGMPIRSLPFDGVKRAEGNLTGWTVERYAEIGAHLRFFPRTDKAAVLERFGLDKAAWESARAAWAAQIKVSAGGDGVLVDRWNTLFDAIYQRLDEEEQHTRVFRWRGGRRRKAVTPVPPASKTPAGGP